MPEFGSVIYNPYEAWVARLNNDNTFGTPVKVEYLDRVSYEYESDTDEIMSGGTVVEAISIPTKVAGNLNNASLDTPVLEILTGTTSTSSGSAPNRIATLDFVFGGSGLPYFGLIVAYAATYDANVLIGFPKCKLDTIPSFDMEQNQFRRGEAEFSGFPASTVTRKGIRMRKYETPSQIPTTATAWNTWFSGMF